MPDSRVRYLFLTTSSATLEAGRQMLDDRKEKSFPILFQLVQLFPDNRIFRD